jgi:hypothetical protein
MRKPALLLFSLLFYWSLSFAQSISSKVINTTGGSYTHGIVRLDWSVGEPAIIESMQSQNHEAVVTNGFLQPNNLVPANSSSFQWAPEEIKILPNPTYNIVEINFLTIHTGTISIEVYDNVGKNLIIKKATSYGIGNIEKINLSTQPAGTYLFYITLKSEYGSIKKRGAYKILKLS